MFEDSMTINFIKNKLDGWPHEYDIICDIIYYAHMHQKKVHSDRYTDFSKKKSFQASGKKSKILHRLLQPPAAYATAPSNTEVCPDPNFECPQVSFDNKQFENESEIGIKRRSFLRPGC